MKIVFALECANIVNNGTGATCLRFAEELRKRGHQVIIIGADILDNKEHPHYVGLKHYHFPVFQPLISKEGFNFAYCEEEKIYQAILGADVVHVFLPFKMENETRLIAEVLGIPVTGAFHLQPQNITSALHIGKSIFLNNVLYYSFKRYMYNQIHHVHCPSAMIANELKEHHYSRLKPWVISNGVSDFFHPVEAIRPLELEGKYIITMTGRLASEKRQDLIIKAIAKSKYNENIQLILCGQGPNKNRLLKLAKKVKLANAPIIEFCKQDKLRDILSYSDLYVHASDFEIEGIGCIEAFACGAVPLISDSKLSATNTFSLDDEHCVFKHGNASDLKDHIEWFYEHPIEKKDLSKKYIAYSKEFGLPIEVERMEKMFLSAIEDKKEGKDTQTLYPRKKDEKKKKRIFKRLLKKGVIKELPPYFE